MSEETEQDTGAEASGAGSGAAAALALNGASREEADAFLREQRALAADQRHHLHEQFKHLRLSIWEKRTGVLLRAATTIVGVAVAVFFGLMVWDAARSSGLIVEPFAVPADMAANGLTGQVVASQMLDKLSAMQAANYSSRPPQPYENNWGDNLKVEIPETGVSIGELQQFLKDWLGHDTRITGEVYHTPTGIAVTAREGSEAGATFTGPESDLDALIQKAAENVYSVTQPFRYANYLDRAFSAPDIADRTARASVIYRQLIAGSNVQEQAWAWYGLGYIEAQIKSNTPAGMLFFQKAIAADPDFTLGYINIATDGENTLSHHEGTLSAALKAKRLLDRSYVPDIDARQLKLRRLRTGGLIASQKGDYGEALRNFESGIDAPEYFPNAQLSRNTFTREMLIAMAHLHDGGGIRAYLLDMGIGSILETFGTNIARLVARGVEDWPAILQAEKATPETIRPQAYRTLPAALAMWAVAHAHTGDLDGAEAMIAQSPADCEDCVIARGQIADMQGQHGRADYWFARVEKTEQSVPFADTSWGEALLERGNLDGAIAKFTLANQKGPHFADPLEGWGEALMKKNQSHLALAKFAEADKYAPNWGRLHLKWGEALGYAGKKDEAQKQYALAAGLDLSNDDRAELARVSGHV